MKVSEILSLLPDNILDDLAVETKVNYYSKKLQGQVIFKLLLYCILSYKDNSLRMMESAYESIGFKLLNATLPAGSIHYSSISERLNSLDAAYFEKLYKACVNIYEQHLSKEKSPYPEPVVIRFDSTIVSLSAALLKTGYHLKGGDADHVKQLKFTIGLGDIPLSAHFFHQQKYTSENTALKEAIFSSVQPDSANDIRVFDKGINSRKTYDQLTIDKVPFITRINVQSRQEEQLPNALKKPVETPTLTIVSDSWAYLFSSNGKAKHPLRLIRAFIKHSGEELLFITNIADLSAEMITEIYRKRWSIEVFFKFLKQELNFSHLINRSENGISVMFYATLIAAVLLLVYKKINKLKGYKIVKHKFLNELETALVKDFIVLCGGNPDLVDQLLNKPPPTP